MQQILYYFGLLLANTDIAQSLTFVHPEDGKKNVRIVADEVGNYKFYNTVLQVKTTSITYYGNFYNEEKKEYKIGEIFNARLKTDKTFEIKAGHSGGKILSDSVRFLEIIHPTWGLILTSVTPALHFSRVELRKIMPVFGMGDQRKQLSLAINVQEEVSNTLRAIEMHFNNDIIATTYKELNKKREKYHVGIITLMQRVPQPHYSIIKRKFQKIIHTNLLSQTIDNFSIACTESGTIRLELNSSENYKKANHDIRQWLIKFNKRFRTEYTPDIFTGETYRPHITLVHSDVVNRMNINSQLICQYFTEQLRGKSIPLVDKHKYSLDIANTELTIFSRRISAYEERTKQEGFLLGGSV